MTSSEPIQHLSEKFPHLTANGTGPSIMTRPDGIAQHLAEFGRAEIQDFDTFLLSIRPQRLGRNPKTVDAVVDVKRYNVIRVQQQST